MIVADTVNIWCTKRSGPFRYLLERGREVGLIFVFVTLAIIKERIGSHLKARKLRNSTVVDSITYITREHMITYSIGESFVGENFHNLLKVRLSRVKLSKIVANDNDMLIDNDTALLNENFCSYNFCELPKTTKFTKVFTCKRFPLYGTSQATCYIKHHKNIVQIKLLFGLVFDLHCVFLMVDVTDNLM